MRLMEHRLATAAIGLTLIFQASPIYALNEERFAIISNLENESFVSFDQELSVAPQGSNILLKLRNRMDPSKDQTLVLSIDVIANCTLPNGKKFVDMCGVGDKFMNITYRDKATQKDYDLIFTLLTPNQILLTDPRWFPGQYLFSRKHMVIPYETDAFYLKIKMRRGPEARILPDDAKTKDTTTPVELHSTEGSSVAADSAGFGYCFSIPESGVSYISALFKAPSNSVNALQVDAFRSYIKSKYNGSDVDITCGFEPSTVMANIQFDTWLELLQWASKVVPTNWRYRVGS